MLLLINLVMLGIELILYRFVLHLIVDSVFEFLSPLFLHGGSQSLYLLELIIDLPKVCLTWVECSVKHRYQCMSEFCNNTSQNNTESLTLQYFQTFNLLLC